MWRTVRSVCIHKQLRLKAGKGKGRYKSNGAAIFRSQQLPKTHPIRSIKESCARLIESFLISDKLLVLMDVAAVRATNLTRLCRKGKTKKIPRCRSDHILIKYEIWIQMCHRRKVCSLQSHTHSDRKHRLIRDHGCHQRDKGRLKLPSSTSAKNPQINQKQTFLYGRMFIRIQWKRMNEGKEKSQCRHWRPGRSQTLATATKSNSVASRWHADGHAKFSRARRSDLSTWCHSRPNNLKEPVSRVHTLLAAKKVKLAAVFMANPPKLALVQVLGWSWPPSGDDSQ